MGRLSGGVEGGLEGRVERAEAVSSGRGEEEKERER